MSRILIIEDDPSVAELERQVLEAEGHAVEVTSDGPTGLLAAQREKPDVIVLDVSLPLFDGNAVLFGLELNPPLRNVAVVVVSGQVDLLERVSVGRATAVLRKPFDLDDLVRVVEQAAGDQGATQAGRP